jgi:hypothetical protein
MFFKEKPAMPSKYDPKHEAALNNIMSDIKGAEPARMFGLPVYKVNGKMTIGLQEKGIIVKVGQKKADDMISKGEAQKVEPLPGRPWKDWVLLTGDFDKHKKLFKDAVESAKKAK